MKVHDRSYLDFELVFSAAYGKLNIVKALLAANADINFSCGDRGTPLVESAEAGHTDCVKLLLEAAEGVENFYYKQKEEALIYSARGGHSDCVKLLLEASSNINSANTHGENA